MTKKKKSVFGFDAIEQIAVSSENSEQRHEDDSNKVNTKTEQGKGTGKRSRKREQAAGSGNRKTGPEQTDGSGNRKTGPEQTDGSGSRTTEPEQTDGSGNGKTGPEQTDGSGSRTTEPEQTDGSKEGFIEQFKEKATRKTVEETHRRQTYLIDNELIKRLDRLARRQPKGFKTAVVNEGIRRVLDEIEGKSY